MAALLVIPAARAQSPLRILYPAPLSAQDKRYAYVIDLLRLALDHTGGHYVLQPSPYAMSQSRVIADLQQGQRLQIAWLNTTKERESLLLPVRFPLYKEMIGWRLLLVRKNDQRFAAVHTLDQLRGFSVGLGADWPDVRIMRAVHLPVISCPDYDSMFTQLQQGKIDYLSRSILEIGAEQQAHQAMGLTIEPHLMLYYPGAFYFFFSPSQPTLAARVQRGLMLASRDGSFQALFDRHWKRIIAAAHVDQRRVLSLNNPLLPDKFPHLTPPHS
jgi:membrane-bound lytic murein transglycosylase MltF